MPLNLGFHYHIPMMKDENGHLKTPGYLGRFLDSLAGHCNQLVCFMHSPRPDEIPQMDYLITASNLTLVDIGLHTSVPHRILQSNRITAPLSKYNEHLDVLLLRGPSPLLPAMAQAAKNIPLVLLLVGDYLAGIEDLPQPRWRKEAIRLWSYWNYKEQLHVAQKALVFVNSRKLYKSLQPQIPCLVETRTTTLSSNDFYERDDTCQGKVIRLLYTGRIDRAKGLFEILAAVDALRQKNYNVTLDLVGWPQKGDTIVDELMQSAANLGISEYIVYHGYKSVGAELFEFYKNADIYVTASQRSEGFPRTLWESMAHSLPIVATNVGSIGYYLKHKYHALIIKPRNVSELTEAIAEYINNPDLRGNIIANSRALVQENTLENKSAELIETIVRWLEKAK